MSTEKLLRHIVLFKFKDDVSQHQIIEVGNAFLALPVQTAAICELEWGKAINETELYTHCLQVTVRTEADMQTYGEHPAHVAIGDKYGHLVESVAVIDYWTKE